MDMKSMTEKEIEEALKKQTNEILVPDSLSPENMVKRIKDEINQGAIPMKQVEKPSGKGAKMRKWMRRISASAAVFLCGGLIAYGGLYGYGKWQQKQTGTGMAQRDSIGTDVIQEANQIYADLEVQREWYEWAKEYGIDENKVYYFDGDIVYDEMAVDIGMTNDMAVPKAEESINSGMESIRGEAESKQDYSDTNVQVEGIDEADIVKTDGEYLYILSSDGIFIVDTKEELKVVGKIPLEDGDGTIYQEMYVRGNKLIVIKRKFTIYYNGCYEEEIEEPEKECTKVLIYNIENKENPELEKELSQDGYYLNSRVNGDYLYFFTEYTTYCPENIGDVDAYVPNVCGEKLAYQDVCILPEGNSSSSLLISAIDLKDNEVKDKIMLTSGASVFYVSEDAIYSAIRNYEKQGNYTEIVKVSYHEDELEYVGKTEIEGNIADQYYMDEKDGFLRIVSHVYHYNNYDRGDEDAITTPYESNRLYVLDENLNEVGRIEDVAPEERLYSCRFMGDMAYFVTFRNMDPLFAADLSDPYHPVLTGQLKIPGFSEYLQPYGDGLLLGIGYDADEENGRKKGVKLSMFDIQNPADITEITSTYLPECSSVITNAKAILANANKNIIGISTRRYDGDMYYYCFSYEDEEFTTNMQEEIATTQTRGVYIGDVLYISNNAQVKAISLEDYLLLETLMLEE